MKTIVLYESGTGFTRQYAEWIAEALGCESQPVKQMTADALAGFDRVLFGGWVMGNTIAGLDKLQKLGTAPAGVFAVGATPSGESVREAIYTQNKLTGPFFYFEGGFRFEKLGFLQRSMLKMVKSSIAKKKDKTEQDIFMEQALGASFDHSSRDCIAPLTAFFAPV